MQRQKKLPTERRNKRRWKKPFTQTQCATYRGHNKGRGTSDRSDRGGSPCNRLDINRHRESGEISGPHANIRGPPTRTHQRDCGNTKLNQGHQGVATPTEEQSKGRSKSGRGDRKAEIEGAGGLHSVPTPYQKRNASHHTHHIILPHNMHARLYMGLH